MGFLPATRVILRKKQEKPKNLTFSGPNDVMPGDQGLEYIINT